MFSDEFESEFEGNTVEEAIGRAVQKIGISKDRLEIKVVCEEKRGLFGMGGAKLAKIKVRRKEDVSRGTT